MFITYTRAGRFGNNLIQYFVTKIFQHHLNIHFNDSYKYIFNSSDVIKKYDNYITVNDDNIDKIIESLSKSDPLEEFKNKHVIFNGYFQNADFLIKHRQYILLIFNSDNEDRVNEEYRVKDISTFIKNYVPTVKDSDIVVHLRLDDFYDKITPVQTIIDILNKVRHKYTDIYVVVDRIKYLYEIDYVNRICYNHKVSLVTSSMLNDFSLLYYSKNIVISNSTFSWVAAYLGKAENNWVPTTWYASNTRLSKLNDKTIIYINN